MRSFLEDRQTITAVWERPPPAEPIGGCIRLDQCGRSFCCKVAHFPPSTRLWGFLRWVNSTLAGRGHRAQAAQAARASSSVPRHLTQARTSRSRSRTVAGFGRCRSGLNGPPLAGPGAPALSGCQWAGAELAGSAARGRARASGKARLPRRATEWRRGPAAAAHGRRTAPKLGQALALRRLRLLARDLKAEPSGARSPVRADPSLMPAGRAVALRVST